MPNLETHCMISKCRTKNEYHDLHEWIDAPSKELKINHRIERHSDNEVYRKYIREKWGERGVIEWLFHIAVDSLHTAFKASFDEYGALTFNFHNFIFKNHDEIVYECGQNEFGFTELPGRGVSTTEDL